MNQKAIGVFDSGLGGLTAVRELIRLLPQENIIFFGDTGRVPYGSRSCEVIRKYARQDMQFLLSNDVKMIIAACGTVSSTCSDIGAALPIPYTGVVLPACRAAVKASKTGRIGVIGTSATIASGSYGQELRRLAPDCCVTERDCPLFVPLVEGGFTDPQEPITRMAAERYLLPMKEQGIDTLILGCTHYPIIAEIIHAVMGDSVTLINTGAAAAEEAKRLLEEQGLQNPGTEPGSHSFYVSDRPQGFANLGGLFLGQPIGDRVFHVEIENYTPQEERE